MNERRKLLLGIGATSAMAAWHKPLINAVVVPAHAETSPPEETPPPPAPPTPPTECPTIVLDDVTSQALSGAAGNTSCGVTFGIFSSDPNVPLEITGIETSALGTDVEVTNDGLGEATMTNGPRVTWIGPIVGSAPGDCTDLANIVPVDDITFTISATCAIDGEETVDPDPLVITLSSIISG